MKPEITSALPILLVDDELDFLKSASITLRVAGYEVTTCHGGEGVLGLLSQRRYALVILDILMPGVSGEQLLPEISKAHPESPVIMLTALNNVETAVDCMRAGAFDYVVKPVEKNRLLASVRKAMEFVELRNENKRLKGYLLSDGLARPALFERFITRNRKMLGIFQYVEAIAQTPMPVLITGETGVGKELVAQIIHDASGQEGEFVSVNIAGLDDAMVSDTLFGHEKGAFTGAATHRDGLVAKAAGGTLFLDEIGDMAVESQVKLLRLLEDKTYYQVGSDSLRTSTARVVVATNRTLSEMCESGAFRSDLYFRLQGHQIDVPSLRQRPEDIPVLVDHFVELASMEFGKDVPVVPADVYKVLGTYRFPGNVRELRNMTSDAVCMNKTGVLESSFFRSRFSDKAVAEKETYVATVPLVFSKAGIEQSKELPQLKDAEQLLIEEALRRSDGNQTTAARLLGLTRSALNKRLIRGKK